MSNTHEADQGPGLLSNAIAIIAFIVVIAIVIWGLLHLANISTSWFTNLFPRSTPTLQISAPAEAVSGTPVTISWKYSGSDAGTFAFLYQCRDGVTLNDANGARVLCGVIHPLVNASSSTMVVTPVLALNASSTLPFSVVFMPNATGTKQVQGTATIALAPATTEVPSVGTGTETPNIQVSTPVSASSQAHASSVSTGPSDLRVRITNVVSGDLSTVQFDIANVGGSPSGSYTFTAYLPTADGYTYFSPTQASLGAGDHVLSTLQFSGSRGGTVSIVVHPSKSENAGNNSDSQTIAAPYDPYQYQSGLYNSYDYGYDPYTSYAPQYSYPTYQYQYPTYAYPNYQYPPIPQIADDSGYYPYAY